MKRSNYFKQLLVLFSALVLLSACDSIPTAPDVHGPDGINPGPGPIHVDPEFSAEEAVEFSYAADQKEELILEGVSGIIYVKEVDGADAFMISARKRVQSFSDEDAEVSLQNLDLLIEEYSDKLFVKTLQPAETDERDYGVDYTITLPKGVDLDISAVNSEVTLEDIEGNVMMSFTNAAVDAEVTLPENGTLLISNVNGDMTVRVPASTSAQFNADSYNGSVEASSLTLNDAAQTSGSVNGVLGAGLGTIELTTHNGDIEVIGF